ncbi:er membrane protein complex [Anaeramoeba ignava]|uniref:Er membrane protein complex n=1 Tax=Anaeramoeba ignava TaxID=1746090 RepID=A0A9Q0L6J4_ANAIG|nr:er membrane protein complex [Anaeramoeba ignava]
MISITPDAYCHIILHSRKHFMEPVTGVLIQNENKDQDINNTVVNEIIPLFHNFSSYTLSINYDIAFAIINVYCEKNGKKIIGLYHGNENQINNAIPSSIESVVNSINSVNKKGILLLLNNKKLENFEEKSVFDVYESVQLKLIKVSSDNLIAEENSNESQFIVENFETTTKKLKELLENNRFEEIFDFEDHLLNPEKNFLGGKTF